MIDPSTIQWTDPSMAQNGKWWVDLIDSQKGFDPTVQGNENGLPTLTTQLVNMGAKPQDGWMFKGTQAPTAPEGANGYWAQTNMRPVSATYNADGVRNNAETEGEWRWVGQQAPAPVARQAPPEEPVPPQQPSDGKTIYNDWDYYRQQARGAAESINKMPFVSDPAELIGLNRTQIANTFYPPAWQEKGVQKTIGPNGSNIAPQLQTDFGNPNLVNTTSGKDWPTLVQILMDNGTVDAKQGQALLGMTNPAKLDGNFRMGTMGLPGAAGGLAGLLGGR